MVIEKDIQLYVIAGPTAVGKTSAAIRLAEKLNTEIVSADSRQIYEELDIGVARPTEEELSAIKHHMIACTSIQNRYTTADYVTTAHRHIAQCIETNGSCIVCGGTGLYIQGLLEGLDDIPSVSEEIRASLNRQVKSPEGLAALQKELQSIDPDYAHKADLQNPRRVIRALSVYRETGTPYSNFLGSRKPIAEYRTKKIVLMRERENLYDRINMRYDLMIEAGLLREVERLLPFREKQALQTVGYRELFKYLDGDLSLLEAISLGKQKSRNYAKRQLTWFRQHGPWESVPAESFLP